MNPFDPVSYRKDFINLTFCLQFQSGWGWLHYKTLRLHPAQILLFLFQLSHYHQFMRKSGTAGFLLSPVFTKVGHFPRVPSVGALLCIIMDAPQPPTHSTRVSPSCWLCISGGMGTKALTLFKLLLRHLLLLMDGHLEHLRIKPGTLWLWQFGGFFNQITAWLESIWLFLSKQLFERCFISPVSFAVTVFPYSMAGVPVAVSSLFTYNFLLILHF